MSLQEWQLMNTDFALVVPCDIFSPIKKSQIKRSQACKSTICLNMLVQSL